MKLDCQYKTVYRKFLWFSFLAKKVHQEQLFHIDELQIDEMESIEHTKLKPLTIALAVSHEFKILGVRVGTIPAKGHLSKISFEKYGPRENQSMQVVDEVLRNLRVKPNKTTFLIKSDAKPGYASLIKNNFPDHPHLEFVAGENKEKRRELKHTSLEKKIYDPLFAINQRMAKFRDHIKRLTRRSWCTTKLKENLEAHIYLYIADNNGYQLL